jgi:hypothetical protein
MKTLDYVRASRKGSREAELENENGFKAVLKVHKSMKTYSRKLKYKEKYV